MARAETKTWLSLDRWATIMGTDPLHFNGIYTSLAPLRTGCSDTWLQYDWQNSQQVGRESLANAIRDAESIISTFVGYNLLPDYEIDERQNTVRVGNRELFSSGINIRGLRKSIRVDNAHIIMGGQRSKTVISAGATVVRSDSNGDGYNDLCTVTVATTITDTNEIRAYFAGRSGADEWEIRPLINVTADGANAVITFNIWQIPNPNLWEGLNSTGIDGDVAANFQTTIDVYRVFTDIETQVQFLTEPFPDCGCVSGTCTTCTHATQNGCLRVRDARNGSFTYTPATYDSDTQAFTFAEYAELREPDQMRLWYLSGWRDNSKARPYQQLDPYWERAIAYFAVALMDREVCICDNVIEFYKHWRDDLSRTDVNRSFIVSPEHIGNPFGTSRGAIYAWERANSEGRRIPK